MEEGKRRIIATTSHHTHRHAKDLEDEDIRDPLGVAVQQTLGVGASFNFDYEDATGLTLDEAVHTLRARAALSAVKRVRHLFDPDRAREEVRKGRANRRQG